MGPDTSRVTILVNFGVKTFSSGLCRRCFQDGVEHVLALYSLSPFGACLDALASLPHSHLHVVSQFFPSSDERAGGWWVSLPFQFFMLSFRRAIADAIRAQRALYIHQLIAFDLLISCTNCNDILDCTAPVLRIGNLIPSNS